jgi:stage III sporulation protein AE
LTGLLTGAADETAIKVTKTAMSGMVPVVGSIISNAASTVLSGAALLKNAAGAFGMLSVLAIFLTPFIKIAISFLLFKFVSAISGVVGSRLSGFLAAVSSAMGYILAMVGSGALMSLVACCFFIKTVNI